ncbi:Aste57867_13642 [Aphanomyces stellatus]|uniref:Aste57867_13642 protein n=1 Tax=Aphanomyces stellatus TaxID=120398 RepID=A0A485KZ05_9STRA|nr:hypothetical protein As57867_013592 [Aphanomyces stellatus]VFT90479.1 Aste57867_13642 [Aphanomyces stellatus]
MPKQTSLDHELMVLVRDDGRRHNEEVSKTLSEYSKQVAEMQEKNKQLAAELDFDSRNTRNDPFYNESSAHEMSHLQIEGNKFTKMIEVERRKIAQYDLAIQDCERTLAEQKLSLGSGTVLELNEASLVTKIKSGHCRISPDYNRRKMETEIDRKMVKFNEKLATNKGLRKTLDMKRVERATTDSVYATIESETLDKTQRIATEERDVAKMREQVASQIHAIETLKAEAAACESSCEEKAAAILKDLKNQAAESMTNSLDESSVASPKKYLSPGADKTFIEEKLNKSKITRSRWKIIQEKVTSDISVRKYNENREFIERIHQVSGTKTVMEMIDAFNTQEVEHFAQIQYVNRLAEDIETYRAQCAKLREEIGKMKLRNDAVDVQKTQRTKTLKTRREKSHDQEAHLVEKTNQIQLTIAALKPALMALHVRIGCKENQDEKSLRGILGEIEHKMADIIHTMHAKSNRKLGGDAGGLPAALSQSLGSASALSLASATEPSILGKSEQPYRYNAVKPPTLTLSEMYKKETAEEEYPLTYDELKAKVWRKETRENSFSADSK